MSKQEQTEVFDCFKDKRKIAYSAGLAKMLGSINCSLMLGQLLYWNGMGKDKYGWIYKTVNEMQFETGLSRYQQEEARKKLLAKNLIEYKRAGTPCKRHFRVKVTEVKYQIASWRKTNQLEGDISPNINANSPPTITKSTQRYLPKNTSGTISNKLKDLEKRKSNLARAKSINKDNNK